MSRQTFEPSYQTALFFRLLAGAGALSDDEKTMAATFILSTRCPSGGFRGRSAADRAGDLYYTSFALRSLALLGALDASLLEGVRHFLEQHRERLETPADLFSFTFCHSLVDGGIDERERCRLLEHWEYVSLDGDN